MEDILRYIFTLEYIIIIFFIFEKRWKLYIKKVPWHFNKKYLLLVPLFVIILYYIVFFVGYASLLAFGSPPVSEDNIIVAISNFSPILLFVVTGVSAVVEEFFFRYMMFEEIKRKTDKLSSVFFTSLMFSLAHLSNPGWNVNSLVVTFFAGLFLQIIYMKYGLSTSMFSHLSYNIFLSLGVIV